MVVKDARVDAYIANSSGFARPILESLRAQVHAACPDAIETIKWSMPFFEYNGGVLCHMAAFKAHCAFGFWRHALEVEPVAAGEKAMGRFGRIESLADLPPKATLARLIRQAMALNAAAVTTAKPRAARVPKPMPEAPLAFLRALNAHKTAQAHFEAFTPGKQREYIDWIREAKTDATRDKRIAQAIEWIAEAKARNWKYERC